LIKRFFVGIKQFRGIAIRYDMRVAKFSGAIGF